MAIVTKVVLANLMYCLPNALWRARSSFVRLASVDKIVTSFIDRSLEHGFPVSCRRKIKQFDRKYYTRMRDHWSTAAYNCPSRPVVHKLISSHTMLRGECVKRDVTSSPAWKPVRGNYDTMIRELLPWLQGPMDIQGGPKSDTVFN